jgi:maleylpyruvate isomerase
MAEIILHNYFRSSTSFRVRVALNLKNLPYEYQSYHLRKGEQQSEAMLSLNPQGLVPALELLDGTVLTQSMAIMEWLDETHPKPPLLPDTAAGRARVRSIAQMIACEIHPINNLRVLEALKSRFGADDDAVEDWFRTWVTTTFSPLEARLATDAETGQFCHGDTPSIADICLVAQVFNNLRFNIDMTPYPTISTIHERCMALEAFDKAKPALQPDAE